MGTWRAKLRWGVGWDLTGHGAVTFTSSAQPRGFREGTGFDLRRLMKEKRRRR